MHVWRRGLLVTILSLAQLLARAAPEQQQVQNDDVDVHTVYLVFSHHLDVGLNEGLEQTEFCKGFATKIIQEYWDDFIRRSIRLSEELRGGQDRFVYTIHPWIVILYVNCVPWNIPDGCSTNPGQLRYFSPNHALVASVALPQRKHLD